MSKKGSGLLVLIGDYTNKSKLGLVCSQAQRQVFSSLFVNTYIPKIKHNSLPWSFGASVGLHKLMLYVNFTCFFIFCFTCSNKHKYIKEYGNALCLFDYRSKISDVIGDALGIDFTRKKLRRAEIKIILAESKKWANIPQICEDVWRLKSLYLYGFWPFFDPFCCQSQDIIHYDNYWVNKDMR